MANSKELMLLKDRLVLNDIQREVLLGILLGDVTILAQEGNLTHNVKFEQQSAGMLTIFMEYLGTWSASLRLFAISKAEALRIGSLVWFKAYRHSEISCYRKIFYPDGKKVVPRPDGWLIPRVLAYWLMDDGGNVPSGYIISSHSFSVEEHQYLSSSLLFLGLETTMRTDPLHNYLYVRSNSRDRFTSLVELRIVPCMRYELKN